MRTTGRDRHALVPIHYLLSGGALPESTGSSEAAFPTSTFSSEATNTGKPISKFCRLEGLLSYFRSCHRNVCPDSCDHTGIFYYYNCGGSDCIVAHVLAEKEEEKRESVFEWSAKSGTQPRCVEPHPSLTDIIMPFCFPELSPENAGLVDSTKTTRSSTGSASSGMSVEFDGESCAFDSSSGYTHHHFT